MSDKKADLAGPGIGNYDDLANNLPNDYEALLPPMERMEAVFAVKEYIEHNLCNALNLQMVQVPLIVDKESGVNDYLDRLVDEMRHKDKNLDEEAVRKTYRTEALFNLKWYYLKQKIAQVENITVGEEDYQSFLNTIEDEKIKKFYQENPQIKGRIQQDLFEKKVFDFLVNNSNIKTIEEKLSDRKELAGI